MLIQAFWINQDFKVVEQGLKMLENDAFSKVTYSDFEDVEGQKFAKEGKLQIELEEPVTVKWNYSKINMTKTLTYSFTIPEKYEPVN